MAGVVVPNFAAILSSNDRIKESQGKQSLVASIMGSLNSAVADYSSASMERKQITAMADSLAETNPQMASAYRGFAESIPAFNVGGGEGGSGGGGGGGTATQSKFLSSMLQSLHSEQEKTNAITVDAAKTANDAFLAKTRAALTIGVNNAHDANMMDRVKLVEGNKTQIQILKNQASAAKNEVDRARLQQQAAKLEADNSFHEEKLKVDMTNANANKERAAASMFRALTFTPAGGATMLKGTATDSRADQYLLTNPATSTRFMQAKTLSLDSKNLDAKRKLEEMRLYAKKSLMEGSPIGVFDIKSALAPPPQNDSSSPAP